MREFGKQNLGLFAPANDDAIRNRFLIKRVSNLDELRADHAIPRVTCKDCGYVWMQLLRSGKIVDDCTICKSTNTFIIGWHGKAETDVVFWGTLEEAKQQLPIAKWRLIWDSNLGRPLAAEDELEDS